MHQTAGGVAAKQGALGALQDLHPLHIELREQLGLAGGLISLVDIDGVRRFRQVKEVILSGAADGELLGVARVVAGDVNAGGHGGDVGAFGDPQGVQLLAGEGGDGDGDILYGFLPFLRGDDHLFQGAALRQDRRRRDEQQRRQRKFHRPINELPENHGFSPLVSWWFCIVMRFSPAGHCTRNAACRQDPLRAISGDARD